ncbi:MAG: putative Ig domain-containing protein [Candidatus Omnitrophota bacterium]|nr:putative Ig domain-containing protein [Candidatus Omnitrophota bacterium]
MAHDFHLLASSPAIDAGADASAIVLRDYDGNTRPQNSIYDIGAFEYASGQTNNSPVLNSIGNKSVNENVVISFILSATDTDGDTLTYSASSLPSGATLNSSTGAFSWTPTYSQAGSYSVTFSVNDGKGGTASEAITIIVNNVNRAPVLTAIGNKSVIENSSLTFTVSATDADGDTLTYSASSLPTGATFSAATRVFSWTPTYSQAGTYTAVHFQVSDVSLTASEDITITVTNSNQAPVLAAIGAKSIAEGSVLTFTISATDADGDTLTYSSSNLPAGAAFNGSNGVFSWTPGYDQAAAYSAVRFSVTDGNLTDSEDITITVTNANRLPVLAAIGARTVNENMALSFTISASDVDGDTLTYSASGLPTGAAFNTSTRTFSWTPTYTQAGSYNVTFSVNDGNGGTASETIAITVSNVNRDPVLGAIGNKSGIENSTLTFTVIASDPDGDTLIYSSSNLPAGATFNASTGVFSWTPGLSQAGSYPAVRFTVTDGNLTDSEDITITVTNTNTPPVLAAIGNQSIAEGSVFTFTLSATDPDGNTLTYSASNLPTGAAFNASSRIFSWTPGYDQAGSCNLTFIVDDGNGGSDSEAVTITVTNVNQAPVLASIGSKTVTVNYVLTFTLTATDADGDTLTYSATNLLSGASLNASTGVFSWSPVDSQIGSYAVTFNVTDTNGALDSETITITVILESEDTQPPYVEGMNPDSDEVQVPLDANIIFHIKDKVKGVDINTLSLSVQREGDSAPTDIILNGENQLSAYPNSVTIQGTALDYVISYDSPKVNTCQFRYEQIITVNISASDLAGNGMGAYSYSFTTAMVLRGKNSKVSKK